MAATFPRATHKGKQRRVIINQAVREKEEITIRPRIFLIPIISMKFSASNILSNQGPVAETAENIIVKRNSSHLVARWV